MCAPTGRHWKRSRQGTEQSLVSVLRNGNQPVKKLYLLRIPYTCVACSTSK